MLIRFFLRYIQSLGKGLQALMGQLWDHVILDEAQKKYVPDDADLEQYGIKLTAMMADADVRYIYDDDPPGVDIDGNRFVVADKLMFTPMSYPDDIEFMVNEVGCVVAEDMTGKVTRLIRVERPATV